MRIGDYTNNISVAGNNNVGDPISNLEKGDVIKAKVIEITANEAVLRLSDGTVIKAKTMEALNVKAGQTVTLTVASKSEGTVFLETVKDSAMIDAKPDIIKNLLNAIRIKPDARNTELASELLKAGTPVTAENMETAAALMKSMPELSAEKAVFIVSSGLDMDQIQVDVINRLLDGDFKVGQQLKEILVILSQISDSQGDTQSGQTGADMQARISDMIGKSEPTSVVPGEQAANPLNQIDTRQPPVSSANVSLQGDSGSRTSAATAKAEVSTLIQTQSGTGAEPEAVTVTVSEAGAEIVVPTSTETSSGTTAEAVTVNANAATTMSAAVFETETSEALGFYSATDTYTDTTRIAEDISAKVEMQSETEPDVAGATNASKQLQNADQIVSSLSEQKDSGELNIKPATDSISMLVEAVKDLFIRTDSEQLASELEIDELNSSLTQRLGLLQIAAKYSEANSLNTSESLSEAASTVSNTLSLINQLNANNMLYYQMPVNLSGYETTAELYIMKREPHSRKKIDVHNTVMFISLDTNNMGRIETLADVKGGTITINIRTESHRINDFIKERAKHLYSGIAACGYKLAGIRYALIDSPATPVQQEKLLSAMLGLSHGKVDYRI